MTPPAGPSQGLTEIAGRGRRCSRDGFRGTWRRRSGQRSVRHEGAEEGGGVAGACVPTAGARPIARVLSRNAPASDFGRPSPYRQLCELSLPSLDSFRAPIIHVPDLTCKNVRRSGVDRLLLCKGLALQA